MRVTIYRSNLKQKLAVRGGGALGTPNSVQAKLREEGTGVTVPVKEKITGPKWHSCAESP